MIRHRIPVLLAVVCIIAGICSTDLPAQETIKIGAVFAVTGPAAFLGEPEANTANMVAEEINARGGIDGKKVELIIEDTQGDNTKAVNAVKKLITKDKVLAIIGPSRSGTTMAVIPLAEKYEVPLISCAAAEDIVVPVKKWVFKTPQKDSDAVKSIYTLLRRHGVEKVGIITGLTGFGKAGRDQLIKYAPEFGLEIVADETYGARDTDMTPQLKKIGDSGAKALVNWSIVPAQTMVMKNARQLGMTIPILQSHGFGNIKYAREAGEAAEGVVFPAGRLLIAETMRPVNCQKEPLLEYKKKYEEKFKDDVSTFGGHAYDAMLMVLNAIIEEGPDSKSIRDYIETTKGFVGTGGVFYFSPEDHNGLDVDAFEMIVVRDGKFYPLGE
jgi:branched-chain amino acid transport system substrate-binding protein